MSSPFPITSGTIYRFEVQKTDGSSFNAYHGSWAGSDYADGHESFDGVFFDGSHPSVTPNGYNLGTTTLLNDLDFGINTTILPVELLSFEAEILYNAVEFKWATASELNNDKFEIEESYDGLHFKKIGEVEGNGTSTEQQNYSFKIEKTGNGIFYYRLKQLDFDGQFEYSKVIHVSLQ